MATTFKNKVVPNIGSVREEVLATNENARVTVVGFSLANLTEGVVLINVEMQDADSTIDTTQRKWYYRQTQVCVY